MCKNVCMRTVLLPMCPTGGPMARGARGDIPGNSLGQGSTSTCTLTHVWGAYRALTLCRRPSELDRNVISAHHERFSRGFEWRRHSVPPTYHPLSAVIAKNRVRNAHGGPKRRYCHAHIATAPFAIVNVSYTHTTTHAE